MRSIKRSRQSYSNLLKSIARALVYYRCPREIDMLGIISDCKGKADIDPELDKASLQEVLDLTTLLLAEDIMDQARYSTIAARIQMFN